MADEHGFGSLIDQHDGDYLPVAGSGLHVDHALAATGLQAIFVHRRALAVAVFGDAEDQARQFVFHALAVDSLFAITVLGSDRHADNVVVFFQIHATDAVSRPSHGTHTVFIEADGHA